MLYLFMYHGKAYYNGCKNVMHNVMCKFVQYHGHVTTK